MKKLLITAVWCSLTLFTCLPKAAPVELTKALEQAAALHKIDAKILLAIAEQTNFDPQWVGDDNRHGLMQLPLKITTLESGISPLKVFNADASAAFASGYISRLLKLYDGDLQSALQHYYKGESSDARISLSWFGSSNRWANRLYNTVLQGADVTEPPRFCNESGCLDDFSDPYSKLNQQRNIKAKCYARRSCEQARAYCRRYH